MYAAGSLQGIKIVIFVAVFHVVHSDYTILWIFTEVQHGPGGGVAESAGVRVRHLGQGEPGPLPGRGKISTLSFSKKRLCHQLDWLLWTCIVISRLLRVADGFCMF
jgi:hypothetical protein